MVVPQGSLIEVTHVTSDKRQNDNYRNLQRPPPPHYFVDIFFVKSNTFSEFGWGFNIELLIDSLTTLTKTEWYK